MQSFSLSAASVGSIGCPASGHSSCAMYRLHPPRPATTGALASCTCSARVVARCASAVPSVSSSWRRGLSFVRSAPQSDAATALQTRDPSGPTPSSARHTSASDQHDAVTLSLRAASALELPRPGTVVGTAAPVPYRPGKALKPATQRAIDSALRPKRRQEHPDWLEKPRIRKMTLQERHQLLTAQHQKWDLEKMTRILRKAKSPFASVHFVDRAHDWFIRVYTHAPVRVYHHMLMAAGRFGQFERMDEYFKLLLQYHAPTPRTFYAMLQSHARAGHTKKVKQIMDQMHLGAREVVAEKVQLPSPDLIFDPTDGRHKLAKKVTKNATFRFPFTEKALYYLIQTHVVNNDTEAILDLTRKLLAGDEIYPTPRPLVITGPIAELLMHYFALHRMLDECVSLATHLGQGSTPVSVNTAWAFFDAFKREVAWDRIHSEARHDIAMQEQQRRRKRHAVDIDAIVAAQRQRVEAEASKMDPMLVPALLTQKATPPHLQKHHPLAPAIRDPFPLSVASQSSGLSRAKTFPASPLRRVARGLKPSPLDATKEDAPFEQVLSLMLQHGFVPTATLFNLYIAYYHENFYPPQGQFPDVMLAQVRVMQEQITREHTDAAFEKYVAMHGATERPSTDAPNALRSAAFAAFEPTAQTYALLIQAVFDRHPLRPATASQLALEPAGPSNSDVKLIMSLRSEMRAREMEPLLATKVNMMQLMAHEEKWTDLYASFTLLWKMEKLRREEKLAHLRIEKPDAQMEDMLKEEEAEVKEAELQEEGQEESVNADGAIAETDANDATVTDADLEKAAASEEPEESLDADASQQQKRLTFTQLSSTTRFTCMSLLPVLQTLAQRPSLERMNLFFGIVVAARDFPLTRDFFQCVLQILGDRGHTSEIVRLLRVMKKTHHIEPNMQQYNTLLSSMAHYAPSPTQITASGLPAPLSAASLATLPKDAKEVMVNMFQTWELMKMLKLGFNQHTLIILLTGCVRYGELEDGRRLWHFIHWKTQFRPNIGMYSLYVEFLVKRGQLLEALSVLRSQSFKDGLDWTLKECYLILDFIESGKLLKLVNRIEKDAAAASAITETNDEAGSSLTVEQEAAVYVPSEQQLQMYKTIQGQARSLSLRLLAWEKRGGKFGEAGSLEVTPPGQTRSHTLHSHRQHHSPSIRAKYKTREEKEADEVLQLSTIPGQLFSRFVPLIELVEEFTGEHVKRIKRDQKKQHVRLLAQSDQNDTDEIIQAQMEHIETIAALNKEIISDTTASSDNTVVELEEQQPAINAPASTTIAAPAAAAAPAALSAPRRKVASEPRPIPSGIDPAEMARRKAEKAALKAAKVAARAERAAASQTVAQQEATVERTPVVESVDAALTRLASLARTRSIQAPVPTPVHPVMHGTIDLCALHAEGRLGSLDIAELKSLQTGLMGQPKPLVNGRKNHHAEVVVAWLKHCTCCANNKQ